MKSLTLNYRSFFSALLIYIISYICTFVVFTDADWEVFFSYVVWSWSGGGEIPIFINMISIGVTILLIFLVFILKSFNKKSN